MVVGRMVRTCPVTKGFTCNTPQDCRRHAVVRRSSRSVAKLFPDVTLFFFLNHVIVCAAQFNYLNT